MPRRTARKPYEYANQGDFIEFLEETLIPDLYENDQDSLAEDFEECVEFLNAGIYDAGYVEWLENQLIPDLRDMGHDYTAEDFETCVRFMRENRRGKRPARAKSSRRR